MIFLKQNNNRKYHSAELTENRSHSRAQHAHFGENADAENKQRVEYDVHDRAQKLEQHGVYHVARRLQGLFNHHLYDRENRQTEHKGKVLHAGVYNSLVAAAERCHERPHAEDAQQQKERVGKAAKHKSVGRGGISLFVIARSQLARDKRVDADSRADRSGDQQQLQGIGQRHGGKAVHVVVAYKNAVDHVVHRQYRH